MRSAVQPPGQYPDPPEQQAELARQEKHVEHEPLPDRLWKQLQEFSRAVQDIELALDSAKATKESVLAELHKYQFGPRQEQYFQRAIETLFHRREIVASAKNHYQERFPETWQQQLFKDTFGTSGTFGQVELYTDENNLVFLCERALDVAQALEQGSDAYRLVQAGEVDQELLDRASKATPAGVFMLKQGAQLPSIGSLDGTVILINVEKIRQRQPDTDPATERWLTETDAEIFKVIRHEQQHAINSLYERPRFHEFVESGQIFVKSADRLDEIRKPLRSITDRIVAVTKKQEEERGHPYYPWQLQEVWRQQLTAEERSVLEETGHMLLKELAPMTTNIVSTLTQNAVEGLAKEELLAFYLSGSPEEEIEQKLPLYSRMMKNQLLEFRKIVASIFMKHYPDDILEELGFQRPDHQRVMGLSTFSLSDGVLRKYPEDVVSKIFAKAYTAVNRFAETFEASTKHGHNLLERVSGYDSAHGTDLLKLLKPILISQPLEHWERIVDRALRDANEAQTDNRSAA